MIAIYLSVTNLCHFLIGIFFELPTISDILQLIMPLFANCRRYFIFVWIIELFQFLNMQVKALHIL